MSFNLKKSLAHSVLAYTLATGTLVAEEWKSEAAPLEPINIENLRGSRKKIHPERPAPRFLVPTPYLAPLEQLYGSLQALGYWEKIQGSCFCLAGVVTKTFTALGHVAQVVPCYAVAARNGDGFAVGYKDLIATPGQADGHVVALIDGKILVDLGLIHVQRHKWPDFLSAIAIQLPPGIGLPVNVALENGDRISWINDWVNPNTAQIMQAHQSVIDKVFSDVQRQFPGTPSATLTTG